MMQVTVLAQLWPSDMSVCIVHVGVMQAGIIARSCWNPYILCFETWTFSCYSAMILGTFLIEIYGMLCIHFIMFLLYCFHHFCSPLHNLFCFEYRGSLILHYYMLVSCGGTKRQQCCSISLWKQKPRDKTQRTMFWFIYVYIYIHIYAYTYMYSRYIYLNLLFAPWLSGFEIAGSKIWIQIHKCC